MPVLFTCPHCTAETVVEDAYCGQSGPCATCGRIVAVPEAEGTTHSIGQRISRAGLDLSNLGLLIGVVAASLVIGVAVIGVGVAIIAPAVKVARASTMKAKSAENLQLIAQALQQYHADYGSYPPAYTTDAKGKRMHSWRVLILPYLGERALYQQYNMNVPWDDAVNMQLVQRMPQVFASPGDDTARGTFDTSYVVIVGRNTIFPGEKTRTMNDITDGTQATLLVAESTESGICWMEPKDLEASKMDWTVNAGKTNCIRSHHPYGAQSVFADGRTHYLTEDLPPEFIEALSTAASSDHAPLDALTEE